jgi:uncharacterized membrane protein YgcG
MEPIVIAACAGLAFYGAVRMVRWAARRDIARCERCRAERERATVASYRANTIPGRRPASADSSTTSTATTPSAWDAFVPAPRDADPAPAVPHVYSSPSLHGAGGSFAGAGASGSWDPSSCGGSDYSSSSDSGSSCSSSSSSGSD